jgi:23S rRNA (cytidine2498-2'-O)-methyltransferase
MWVYTCRPGFDDDLAEEIGGRRFGPGLVTVEKPPAAWPVFARAGFPVAAEVRPEEVPAALAAALDRAFAGKPRAWTLNAWVPDTDQTNPLAARAEKLASALRPDLELLHVPRADDAVRYGGFLAQACLVAEGRVLVGVMPAHDSPTLAPGGRARAGRPKDAPSRAARKLEEAFLWIGRAPEPGETCVDLGAAPGGWTAVLLKRRARVIAVDPALLAPDLARRVRHVQASAFDYAPDEPVDWLFCDMAWRPLEVAQLLAKWARRGWATAMVSNIKLPMKQRVTFVRKVMAAVAEGGWRDLRGRQLYHDREEITLSAWR